MSKSSEILLGNELLFSSKTFKNKIEVLEPFHRNIKVYPKMSIGYSMKKILMFAKSYPKFLCKVLVTRTKVRN